MGPFARKIIQFFVLGIASLGITIFISFLVKQNFDISDIPDEPIAGAREIPYHVVITLNDNYQCSGTLIHNDRYVLTAAQCVFESVQEKTYKTQMKVYIGTRVYPGGYPHDVEKISCHPSYNFQNPTDNIAVIKLMEKVKSKSAKSISLPKKGEIINEGLTLLVSGYGNVREKLQEADSILHRFEMTIIGIASCRRNFNFEDKKFCAVSASPYPPCLGDRGSPATIGKKYIIGIYEAQTWGCLSKNPELFVDVSKYLDFIMSALA